MVRLHPRVFAIAVAGASVFALCTVASSFAVRWVIDNVILPRFEEGEVAVGDRDRRDRAPDRHRGRAGGRCGRQAHVRGDHAVAGRADAHRRRDRSPRAPTRAVAQRRADGELVARAGVDADAAVSVLAPIPFATSTVLMIVVAGVWMIATDVVLGLVAVAVFPILIVLNVVYQHRVDRHYNEAQDQLGALSAGVHESFEGVQLIKAYGAEAARDRATVDDRRPHPRRPDQRGAPARHVRGGARGDPVDRERRPGRARRPPCQRRATSPSASSRASSTCSRCWCSRCA